METLIVSKAVSSSSVLMKMGCDFAFNAEVVSMLAKKTTRVNYNVCERPMRWIEIKLIERVQFSFQSYSGMKK